MNRGQVKRIVGFAGKKGRTTHYSDGTIAFSIDYRMCKRGSKRPDYSYMTTTMYYATQVKYGKYEWDSCADFDYDFNCVGAYVWNEYAENGHTRVPKIDYKGSY